MMLSKSEQERYSRHLKLEGFGLENQMKLKNAKVLMIGVGGLGCPVVQYLAAAGVGVIGLVDSDVVSFSNLQRQILFKENQLGKLKVEAAKAFINELNAEVDVITHPVDILITNAHTLVDDYDVVIDGTDNFATRYLINDICQIHHKTLVFGSIFTFEGQVTVFHYQDGPSYRCLYPNPPAFGTVPSCSEIGVLGVLPGIIGNYMALEAIKVICGIGEVLSGKLLSINTLTNKQHYLTFEKQSETITTLLDDYQQFCGMPIIEKSITVTELHQLTLANEVQIVDVREDHERDICHIGGKHIPLNDIPGRFDEINENQPVYMLCHHGMRSAMAQQWLLENTSLKQVVNVEGGIHAWAMQVDDAIATY